MENETKQIEDMTLEELREELRTLKVAMGLEKAIAEREEVEEAKKQEEINTQRAEVNKFAKERNEREKRAIEGTSNWT